MAKEKLASKLNRETLEGTIHSTKYSGDLIVEKYVNYSNVVVRFLATGYRTKTTVHYIRLKNVRDNLLPHLCGIGYIGEGVSSSDNKKCYRMWAGMISRCYSEKSLVDRPTYRGCSVDKQWHNFQNFLSWYQLNYKEGYVLDKDILSCRSNKVYSEATCVLIPQSLNKFMTSRVLHRGPYPLGVTKTPSGTFKARCGNPFTLKRDSLGVFKTKEEAHEAWKRTKHHHACKLAEEQEDERVKHALQTMYLPNTIHE